MIPRASPITAREASACCSPTTSAVYSAHHEHHQPAVHHQHDHAQPQHGRLHCPASSFATRAPLPRTQTRTTPTRKSLAIIRHSNRAARVDGLADTLTDPAAGPERTVLDAETAQAVRDLVAELPPRRRALIQAMCNQDTHRYTEISRDTGIPIGGLGPTRARALRQLRRMIDERGLGHPR
jgi:hypothetical protein